jgi:beta-glucanase (GH16 family)
VSLRTRRSVLALITAATAVALLPAAAPARTETSAASFRLVWKDDFNGRAGKPLGREWLYDLGHGYGCDGCPTNWGTGEIELMTDSTRNVRTDAAGNLVIRALKAPDGTWTSGRVETRKTFTAGRHGVLRVEARLQQPDVSGDAAAGYWPAFWMLGKPFRGNYLNWPGVGEIDIMEDVNGSSDVFSTLHCGTSPGGPCNETSGIGGNRACPGATCQSAFHTYAIEWDRSVSPEQIRWYVDGTQYHSVSANQVDANTWANATQHGYFVILNVAMGGGWPGNPTGSTASGVPMLVDYVAVWNSGGGTTTPPPTTPPPTGGTRNAYATIEAESYNAQGGTQTEACAEGGSDVGWIANGDWLQFNNVDFGGSAARTFNARVASGAAGGVSGLVEVRLDSRSNAPIGSFAVANTGGWQTWRTIPGGISGVTGTHTVFLTFTSGQPADYVNVNWLSFAH